MIVCHCMSIRCSDIHSAIDWMRASDPDTIITPGKVYHALGKKPDCGGCLPLFLETMAQNPKLGVPPNLRAVRRISRKGTSHEGRSEGHRVSQRGAAQ